MPQQEDVITAPAAHEVTGSIPDRWDMYKFAAAYERRALEIEFDWATSTVARFDFHELMLARACVRRGACYLGDSYVDAMVRRVRDEFERAQEPEHWDAFLSGVQVNASRGSRKARGPSMSDADADRDYPAGDGATRGAAASARDVGAD